MLIVVPCVLSTNTALASGSRVWKIQDTGYSALTPFTASTAVALRAGQAWPVIFNRTAVVGQRASLGPQGTYWHDDGAFQIAGPIVAKSSSDGRIIAFTPAFNGDSTILWDPTDGYTLINHAAAGAFAPDGTLVYAEPDGSVPGLGAYSLGAVPTDLAVAPDGTVGIIDWDGYYHEYRLGQWNPAPFDMGSLGLYSGQSARLTFDAQSRPHIIGNNSDLETIAVFSFSTQTGQWTETVLGISSPLFSAAAIDATTANGGEVGVAFVESGTGELKYAYSNGIGDWTLTTIPTGSASLVGQGVGLDFDFEGLPVVSYIDSGNLHLAYDPIEAVPEPGAAALVTGMAAVLVRRRRRDGR